MTGWPGGDLILGSPAWGDSGRLAGRDQALQTKGFNYPAAVGWGKSYSPSIGSAFTPRGGQGVPGQWNGMEWSPELGLFCAVAFTAPNTPSAGLNRIMTSPDGINWTIREVSQNVDCYTLKWSRELGIFCCPTGAAGNSIMTSPDGIDWTFRSTPTDSESFFGIEWSPDLGIFCAVTGSGTGNRVMTSSDGINWTRRSTPTDNNWNRIAWSPELGLFCATSNSANVSNNIMISPDGINWTTRSTPLNVTMGAVAWSRELGIFCVVTFGNGGASANARAFTSPDGINWTRHPTPSIWTGSQARLLWIPELKLFFSSSLTGGVATSPDGINWTIIASRPTTGEEFRLNNCAWSPQLGLIAISAQQQGTTGTPPMVYKIWTSP